MRTALDALLPPDWRDGPLPSVERLKAILSDRRIIIIIAEGDNSPVGYVSGQIAPSLCREGDTATLDDLFVSSASRRRGIGKALVRAFRSEALTMASRPLSMWSGTGVDNLACRRVFESEGAKAVGETYVEYVWDIAPD